MSESVVLHVLRVALLITGTTIPDERGEYIPNPYMDFPEASGAGYVITTADDYARWMRCLVHGDAPLTPAITEELWTARTICPPDDDDTVPCDGGLVVYALGWFIGLYRGHRVIFHAGGLVGAGSLIMVVPELKWGATFLANGTHPSMRIKGLLFELLDHLLGVAAAERTARKRCTAAAIQVYQEHVTKRLAARHKLYPDAPPRPTVPLALPLEHYAGTYHNTGYGSMTWAVGRDPDGLTCTLDDRTWAHECVLEHVNGEHWIMTMSFLQDPMKTVVRAETKIGFHGKVAAMGVAMEAAMPDTLIWFTREA